MRQEDGYVLQKLADNYYILPYGQQIVDFQKSIQTNESGAFLWTALEEECTQEELLAKYAAYYQAEEEEIPEIRQDMNLFLNQLRSQHMIQDIPPVLPNGNRISRYLSIAGITLRITAPKEAFFTDFNAFFTQETQAPEQNIDIYYHTPHKHQNGPILLRNEQLILCDIGQEYLLLFPASQNIAEAYLQKDGTSAAFFCCPVTDDELALDIFHAIRFVYLYLAQKKGFFALHSASILYRNQAWLFSGKSGTGKSTHTKLWNQLFDTPLINGDVNLISLHDNKPLIHGIPWSGTSHLFDTATYPLGGIVLLKQAEKDLCVTLRDDEKQLLLQQRLISPSWTKEQLLCNLSFTKQLSQNVLVYRLLCTKNESAAITIKEQIDAAQSTDFS